MTRFFSIPFWINLAAGADGNDCSLALTTVKQIVGAYISFPAGASNLLQVRFFETGGIPTTNVGLPGGREITQRDKASGIYSGDGYILPVIWQKKPEDRTFFFAMYANNLSPSPLAISAEVIFQE